MSISIQMSRWLLDELTKNPNNPTVLRAFEACESDKDFKAFLEQESLTDEMVPIRQHWQDLTRS